MAENNREQWKTQLGFILAAMGSAIGLGNIWRFPYTVYANGGFAFLVPYLVALFVVGIPLLIVEFGLGHHMKASAPLAFKRVDKRFGWVGWWAVTFVMFGIVIYYAVVISWCVDYFFLSFTKGWGNDPVNYFNNDFLKLVPPPAGGQQFTFGPVVWKIFFALILVWGANWIITVKGIQKGIEKAVKIFMPLLLGVITLLVIWSVTFKGAGQGLSYYLNPFEADWSKLSDPDLWIGSMGQIFFTLSLGFGIMIAYASYLPQNVNVVKAAAITALGNSFFSIFAAIAVFSTIGFMAYSNNVSVRELKDTTVLQLKPESSEQAILRTKLDLSRYEMLRRGSSARSIKKLFRENNLSFARYQGAFNKIPLKLSGPGLIFKTYPLTLNKIPGGALFAILFFAALVIAGLSSSISIIEAFNSALSDQFNLSRTYSTSILCGLGFLGGIPFVTGSGLYLLDVVDHFLLQYGLVMVGILESIIVGWYFTSRKLRMHIDEAADMQISSRGEFIMRIILTVLLVMTWLVLAIGPNVNTIGSQVAMLAIIAALVLMWLSEHWFDYDIKLLIPALLMFILNGALVKEINTAYSGYNVSFVMVGVMWIFVTLLVAFIFNFLSRKKS